MDKTEVRLDFHIFAILEFDLLLGYPFEKLFQEKSSHGSLNEKFGKTTSTTPIFRLEIPMAKRLPNHDPFEEVKFTSPFISPKASSHPCETKCLSSPSLEPKTCPSGHPNVVLDNDRDSTFILYDISIEKENFCATNICVASTLETR